jgi:hypothetical protein
MWLVSILLVEAVCKTTAHSDFLLLHPGTLEIFGAEADDICGLHIRPFQFSPWMDPFATICSLQASSVSGLGLIRPQATANGIGYR